MNLNAINHYEPANVIFFVLVLESLIKGEILSYI